MLKTDSKCSNTIVYAPLLNRFSPCFVEHLNVLESGVKSRIHAGNVIYYSKIDSNTIYKDIKFRLIVVYVAAATYKKEANSKLIGALSGAL